MTIEERGCFVCGVRLDGPDPPHGVLLVDGRLVGRALLCGVCQDHVRGDGSVEVPCGPGRVWEVKPSCIGSEVSHDHHRC